MPADPKLTRSCSEGPPREVALDDLVLRKDLQPRGKPGRGDLPESSRGKAALGKLSIPTVKRYATALRNGDTFDPILVARYRGKLYVVDGFHRVEAYRAEGYDKIPAVIRSMSLKEARWAAVAANAANGLPLPPGIKREAFKRYMQADMHLKPDGSLKSYRDMAADFRGLCSKSFIQKWMVRDFPRIAKQLADGVENPTDAATMNDGPPPPIHTPLDELFQSVEAALSAALEEAGSSPMIRSMFSTWLRQKADHIDSVAEATPLEAAQ